MKPTFTRILLLSVFFVSLVSTLITGLYFFLFSRLANPQSLLSAYDIYPYGFHWTFSYRRFFLLKGFLLQAYVLVISALILMLSIRREIPGRGYLVGFLIGWLFEWPKILLAVYSNAMSISLMFLITNLAYIGYMIRLVSLLFLMLQTIGALKKSDRILELLVIVSFEIIFLTLKIDVTGIWPSGLLTVINFNIILGLTGLVGIVLLGLPLARVIIPVFRTKSTWNPSSIFFIFLANTALFFSYSPRVFLTSLIILVIVTLWLFYDVCIKHLWFRH